MDWGSSPHSSTIFKVKLVFLCIVKLVWSCVLLCLININQSKLKSATFSPVASLFDFENFYMQNVVGY